MAVIVPLPVPEGVTVHHVWLLVTVQDELEVTENVVDPAAAVTGRSEGLTDKVGEDVPMMDTSSTQTP